MNKTTHLKTKAKDVSGLGGWPRRLVLAGGLDFSLLLDMGVAMPLVDGLLSLYRRIQGSVNGGMCPH